MTEISISLKSSIINCLVSSREISHDFQRQKKYSHSVSQRHRSVIFALCILRTNFDLDFFIEEVLWLPNLLTIIFSIVDDVSAKGRKLVQKLRQRLTVEFESWTIAI